MKKSRVYKILKDYQNGKINKYVAMDVLDLDSVGELFDLLAEYDISPSGKPEYFQSDSTQKPLASYLSNE